MIVACAICGCMTRDETALGDHLIAEHADEWISWLVKVALKEACEVAELNRLWNLR